MSYCSLKATGRQRPRESSQWSRFMASLFGVRSTVFSQAWWMLSRTQSNNSDVVFLPSQRLKTGRTNNKCVCGTLQMPLWEEWLGCCLRISATASTTRPFCTGTATCLMPAWLPPPTRPCIRQTTHSPPTMPPPFPWRAWLKGLYD